MVRSKFVWNVTVLSHYNNLFVYILFYSKTQIRVQNNVLCISDEFISKGIYKFVFMTWIKMNRCTFEMKTYFHYLSFVTFKIIQFHSRIKNIRFITETIQLPLIHNTSIIFTYFPRQYQNFSIEHKTASCKPSLPSCTRLICGVGLTWQRTSSLNYSSSRIWTLSIFSLDSVSRRETNFVAKTQSLVSTLFVCRNLCLCAYSWLCILSFAVFSCLRFLL